MLATKDQREKMKKKEIKKKTKASYDGNTCESE